MILRAWQNSSGGWAITDERGYGVCRGLSGSDAAEIVRRYNGYADQQKLIEQLVEACQKGEYRLLEIGEINVAYSMKPALDAAKEQKEKK